MLFSSYERYWPQMRKVNEINADEVFSSDTPSMAREMDENRKCQAESAAKIMIGKIGGTNRAVLAVKMRNVSYRDLSCHWGFSLDFGCKPYNQRVSFFA